MKRNLNLVCVYCTIQWVLVRSYKLRTAENSMHNLLSKLHQQLLQFNKSRNIYFIDIVKFNLDTVE